MSSTTNRSGLGHFEDTVRNFWATRPLRPRVGGKLGGVSAAIGDRYGIDPILVRIAFILATLYGGAGLVLYLLGWLLFPKEGTTAAGSNEPAREPTSAAMAVVLVLLLIPGVFWLTSSPAIIGLAVGLGVLYLVHRNYGERGNAPAITTTPDATTFNAGQAVPVAENTWVYPGAEPVAGERQHVPPSWDPLGVAPFAWDLPEPEPDEPEPARPRRLWFSFVTMGSAAFFAGLATTLGAPLNVALAIALGVLGLGLIVGAFLRCGRGMIWAAIPVGALAMLLSIGSGADGFVGGVGGDEIRPRSIQTVLPHYQKSAGSILLDLQQLDLANGQELRTGANVGMGSIVVLVPPDVDVTTRCASELGSVQCLGDSADGRSAERSVVDQGEDGPGGGHIVLDLVVGTGDVEVIRG